VIVAVGLNPAVDRTVEAPGFRPGGVTRARLVSVEAAGKATNVARTLAALGRRPRLLGFLGARDAAYFKRSLAGTGVSASFTPVPGETRRNYTIMDSSRRGRGQRPTRDTHITEEGFEVRAEDLDALRKRLGSILRGKALVAFCGSLPPGLGVDDLARLIDVCARRRARVVVDTSGEPLRQALRHQPFLIKPNLEELSFLTGRRPRTERGIVRAAGPLLAQCPILLISLGGDGAICLTREGAWRARDASPPKVVHTVGCGDALLAGFLAGIEGGAAIPDALRLAVACGSACVASQWASLRSRDEADRHTGSVEVKPVG